MGGQGWTCLRYLGNNFGDNLNAWLCQYLGISRTASFDEPFDDGDYLLGIGSMFNGYLKPGAGARLHVLGTGAGYHAHPPALSARIHFLRGPLSCDWLGVPRRFALGDGAYMLDARIREAAGSPMPDREYGLILHHGSNSADPAYRPPSEHVLVIAPQQEPAAFIREVARCRKVVTECLHGAIVADMLGIPFAVVQTTPLFHSFKWLDWLQSLRLPFELQALDRQLPLRSRFDALRFMRSNDQLREALIHRAVEHAQAMRTLVAHGDRG